MSSFLMVVSRLVFGLPRFSFLVLMESVFAISSFFSKVDKKAREILAMASLVGYCCVE